jgi:hypothetical protein
MFQGQGGPVTAGPEKYGMPEAEKSGIAEQQVVTDGKKSDNAKRYKEV